MLDKSQVVTYLYSIDKFVIILSRPDIGEKKNGKKIS